MTSAALRQLAFSFRAARALYAGVELGLFEALGARALPADELARARGCDARAVGIWFGRQGSEAAVLLVSAQRRVHLEPVSAVPGPDGRIVLRGEILIPAQSIDGLVNQGRYRVAPCQADPAVRAPRFVFSCATDKDDENKDKLLVPLRELAAAEPGTGPSTIRHKDLVREVRVSANPDGRSLGEISADVEAAVARLGLKPGYDVVIVGAGGHGLATAYYLAKEHGITDVAVLEKGWLGGGNTGRNTTIIRSNYLLDANAGLYEFSLKLWEGLSRDLNYNVMASQRGVVNLAHSDAQMDGFARRGNAMRLNGIDAELLGARRSGAWSRFWISPARRGSRSTAPCCSGAAEPRAMTRSPGASRARPTGAASTSSRIAR